MIGKSLLYYFYIKVIFIMQLFDEFSKDNIYNPKVNNFYYKKVRTEHMSGWGERIWTTLDIPPGLQLLMIEQLLIMK